MEKDRTSGVLKVINCLLLDDYIRDDEKEITQREQTDITAAGFSQIITERKLEKDA